MCLFLQFTLNADELLESSSCFQGTKRSTFIQHFPVHQEKELELCRIVLLNTTAWYFSVVLLKVMNIRDNPTPADLKLNFAPFEKGCCTATAVEEQAAGSNSLEPQKPEMICRLGST